MKPPDGTPATPAGAWRALPLALASVLGFSSMALEFSAARLLAPAFGQSIHVWSAVIALLLGALAVGSVVGGRWASAPRPPALRLGLALALGAVWVLGAALAGPALLRTLAPVGFPRPSGVPLGLSGSMIAAVVLFALPLVSIALPGPWLVAARGRLDGGAASGGLFAAGTLGALVGCWLTPLVLLQTLGTRATLLSVAGLLGVASLAAALGLRRLEAAAAPPPPAALGIDDGRARKGPILLVAFLTGFATLAFELLAVRFFSPWLGQSNRIWANVIGVVLLGLSLGGWLGGRLARAPGAERAPAWCLSLCAAWVPLCALLGPRAAEWLVPRNIDAMQVLPVAFSASLVLSAALLAPAAVLLGAVPPLLVTRLAPLHGVGRAVGGVNAAGTLGCVAGTFAAPLVLVPWLGSQRALLGVAALLFVSAAACVARWRGVALGLGACLAFVVGAFPRAPVRVHPGQIEECESAYQSVRVVRESVSVLLPDAAPGLPGTEGRVEALFLRHDEDAETYQSLWIPRAAADQLTGGRYYEQLALGSRLARWEPGTPLRVLIIGYAGGALHRVLRDTLPAGRTLAVLGVEIDPVVVEVARRHLNLGELEGPDLRLVTGEDARTIVNALPDEERFDLVLVDAYARTNYIPFQLATIEFFTRVRRHLKPGGWVGVNVLGTGLRGPVCRSVATTLTRALGPTFVHPNLNFPGNAILWSSANEAALPLVQRVAPGERLAPLLEVSVFALERLGVRHVPERDGGVLLTDDLSPSDRLADEELGL